MKTLNKLKLISLFSFIVIGISSLTAQCTYNVYAVDSLNPPGITFFSNASGSTYFWDFGDGNTSTQQSPIHNYASPGLYYYCLIIDSCPPVCDSVIVAACSSNASFSPIDNGGGNYTFNNTSTGSNLAYYWDFGDGNYSSTISPNHTYISNGVYVVNLFIEDTTDSNCYDNTSLSISVTSSACNGTPSFNYVDNGNGSFSFTNTSTGYNAPTYYYWNFGDGNSSSTENPNHTYATNGTYYVSFGIYDATCNDSIWQQIAVTNITTCNANALFTYQNNGNGNFNFANASTGNNLAYLWNFGDGTTSTQANPNHTYLADGTYAISLFVYDTTDSTCFDYNVLTTQVTGTANSTQCNAAFIMFPDSSANNIIVLNTSTGNNLTYFWNFGDGNTSTLQYPSYTYSTTGPFNLCLTVNDGNGCSSTYCDSIGVNGVVLKQSGFTINVQAPTTTGIEANEVIITEIATYPNPIKDNLTIELTLKNESLIEMSVVNLIGNTVAVITNESFGSGTNKFQWNTSNVANGIYLLNIKTGNNLQVKKLVVNK